MRCQLLMLGLLFVAAGCPSGPSPPDLAADTGDMAKPAMCPNEGTLAVGDPCDAKKACQCSSDVPGNVSCLKEIDLSAIDPNLPSLTLSMNYCSSKPGKCTPGKTTECGDGGICVSLFGLDPQCYKKCKKGQCRQDYACFSFDTDPNNPMSTLLSNICIPNDPLLTDCDPTADNQCTMYRGSSTADQTNGNPNAGCARRGPDNVGLCQFLPCQIGPKNCPTAGTTCLPINLATQYPGGLAGDKGKGTFCLGQAKMIAVGQACMYLNDCVDNAICNAGKCAQLCYGGMQPTFPGGKPMYKNAALACPMGTTCKDVLGPNAGTWGTGANYPGACQ